jgi:hypothetical protein
MIRENAGNQVRKFRSQRGARAPYRSWPFLRLINVRVADVAAKNSQVDTRSPAIGEEQDEVSYARNVRRGQRCSNGDGDGESETIGAECHRARNARHSTSPRRLRPGLGSDLARLRTRAPLGPPWGPAALGPPLGPPLALARVG